MRRFGKKEVVFFSGWGGGLFGGWWIDGWLLLFFLLVFGFIIGLVIGDRRVVGRQFWADW